MMPEGRSGSLFPLLCEGICPKVSESRSRSLEMSAPQVFPDQVCYVNCNFCNTVLVVNVPCGNPFTIASVRCGHCANMLSVNLGNVPQRHPAQGLQTVNSVGSQSPYMESGSSSRCAMIASRKPAENVQRQMLSIPSPEKRQRVPSAYNKFIKEEIRRLKESNPAISHREAFSAAAKNWAHFPRIHFGLSVEGDKQTQ